VIKEKLQRLLQDFKKEMKSVKKMKPEKRASLVAKWQTETLNIAKSDWKKVINADKLISRSAHKEKIAILSDYIEFPGSR